MIDRPATKFILVPCAALLLVFTGASALAAIDQPTAIKAVVKQGGELVTVHSEENPREAARSPSGAAPSETDFARAKDGLFYVTANVNGQPVRFLVDTGASVVMLTRADAILAGVDFADDAFSSQVQTANGAGAMAWTKLQRVSVAGHDVRQVDAAVLQDGLPVSLLGQNLLSRLGPVTMEGDHLHVGQAKPLGT